MTTDAEQHRAARVRQVFEEFGPSAAAAAWAALSKGAGTRAYERRAAEPAGPCRACEAIAAE